MTADLACGIEVLKRSANRTVHVDSSRGEVVKRFASPGRMRRWGDGRRARTEFANARSMARAGLPVPEVLAVERARGAYEVRSRLVPHAVPLARLARGGETDTALARRLGTLFARTQAAGVRLGDLHDGNVIVDERGAPWLVDFQHARLGSRPSAARERAELVALACAARVDYSERFRTYFFLAWRRTAAATDIAGARHDADFVAAIEEAGRSARRRLMERRGARWRRESGVTTRVTVDGARAVLRRDLAAGDDGVDLLRATTDALHAGRSTFACAARDYLCLTRDAARAWRAAARLVDHDVPSARPALLLLRPQRAAVFELPAGVVPLSSPRASGSAAAEDSVHATRRDDAGASALARLYGRLHDRGLATRGPISAEDLLASTAHGRHEIWFAPSVRLRGLDQRRRLRDWRSLRRVAAGTPADVLFAAYVAEERGGAAARRRLRALLGSDG